MNTAQVALVVLTVLAALFVVGLRRATRHEAQATEYEFEDGDRVCYGVCRCGARCDMSDGHWSRVLCRYR